MNALGHLAVLVGALVIGWFGPAARADDAPSVESIKAAVLKSLPLLETGAKGPMTERKQCFTCHNQGLPIMALTTARARGLAIDVDHLQTQLEFTAKFLGKNKENYR